MQWKASLPTLVPASTPTNARWVRLWIINLRELRPKRTRLVTTRWSVWANERHRHVDSKTSQVDRSVCHKDRGGEGRQEVASCNCFVIERGDIWILLPRLHLFSIERARTWRASIKIRAESQTYHHQLAPLIMFPVLFPERRAVNGLKACAYSQQNGLSLNYTNETVTCIPRRSCL